jgi:hypothetical protein
MLMERVCLPCLFFGKLYRKWREFNLESNLQVTVSPRLSSGEQEPEHDSSIAVTLFDGTGIANNTMTENGRWSNCTSWKSGLLAVSQPRIFGLGPTGGSVRVLRSDSETASIERHSKYGVKISLALGYLQGSSCSNVTSVF